MGSTDEVLEVSSLERQLLVGSTSNEDCEDDEIVLYNASFEEMENSFIKYQTTQWILYSLLLILAWGIGVLMLLYLPVQRYILRKDFRQRRLYITRNAIVYKVRRPVLFPCFGVLKKEKHVLLPSVADVVVEQGYLQSFFGVYSIRIENAGVRKPSSDDVQIQGLADPWTFRKAVLMHLVNASDNFTQQTPVNETSPSVVSGTSTGEMASTSRSLKSVSITPRDEILHKLLEVESSVKRMQTLMEKQAQPADPSV